MKGPNPDFDLSFLAGHRISKIAFFESHLILTSYGENYHALTNPRDIADVTIRADFDRNGNTNDRCALLELLGKSYEKAVIDTDFCLCLDFGGGDKLAVRKDDTGFECYLIESYLLPGRFVAIV